MTGRRRYVFALLAVLAMFVVFTAESCGGEEPSAAKQQVESQARRFEPYIPRNAVELSNYNRAQKLYDSPDTIIWCSTTWGNPSSPIITVPIAGKLTSSSTTFFRPEDEVSVGGGDGPNPLGTARSVDGLFHPNPPQYRYGFTPGEQYVDFFNMPTVCTTALTSFQRQSTEVTVNVDPAVREAQRRAEAALARGDNADAQRILQEALNGG